MFLKLRSIAVRENAEIANNSGVFILLQFHVDIQPRRLMLILKDPLRHASADRPLPKRYCTSVRSDSRKNSLDSTLNFLPYPYSFLSCNCAPAGLRYRPFSRRYPGFVGAFPRRNRFCSLSSVHYITLSVSRKESFCRRVPPLVSRQSQKKRHIPCSEAMPLDQKMTFYHPVRFSIGYRFKTVPRTIRFPCRYFRRRGNREREVISVFPHPLPLSLPQQQLSFPTAAVCSNLETDHSSRF